VAAVEIKALARSLAVLLAIVCAFMFVSALAAVAIDEARIGLKAFGIPSALGLCLGLSVYLTRRKYGRTVLSPRAGYMFVTLGWALSAGIGALPFFLSGAIPSYVDAYFETMSGFTTTGATILTNIEFLPRCLLLWRAATHWLGGMGIVVLTVAILPLLGISGRALMEAEAPGPSVDKFTPRLSQTAKILWLVYLGLTLVQTVLLMFGGMDWLDALTHSFATMATGGFSTKNLSVGAYNSAYIDWVVTIFMVLAGINFSLHWKLLRGQFAPVFRDTELRTYLAVFVVSTLLVSVNLLHGGLYTTFGQALRYAAFQNSSILTTTGFATADYLGWPAFSQTILFVLMMIGGCAGSTAGGIKVGRIVTLFKMGFSELKYLLNPRGIYGVYVDGRYLKKNVVYDIAAMVFLYAVSVVVSTLVISFGGFDVMTSLSATLATLGNIGPGFSLVGPAFNYDFFPMWIKAWLSFIMMLGRLEIFTVLVIFTRAFWKK